MGVKKQAIVVVKILSIFALFLGFAFTQKTHAFSFCGKSEDCSLSVDEFLSCKKELTAVDSKTSINSFVVTIQKIEKKETFSIQYKSKGNKFSKSLIESIETLHKEKKLGKKVLIEEVEIIQSGQSAKKDAGITITLY